jgi:rubrerythrin
MDADSLRHKAHRYRQLARSINDEKTVAILEEMARELDAHAKAAAEIVEFVPRAPSAAEVPRRKSKRAR